MRAQPAFLHSLTLAVMPMLTVAAFAASVHAQNVTAIPAMTVPCSSIDMDAVGPAGPTDFTQINLGGAPNAANLVGITLTANAATGGIYDTNPQGLGLGLVGGALELIPDTGGAFDGFDARIDLAQPSTQFGLGVGDWDSTMALDFYLRGVFVTSYTTPSYMGATAPQFFAMSDGCFDRVDVRSSSASGNWVITDLAIEACGRELSTTFPANVSMSSANGAGMFFDLDVAYAAGIEIHGLTLNIMNVVGTAGTIDVYTRSGTALGHSTSPAGWDTEFTGVAVTSAGDQQRTHVALPRPIYLRRGLTGIAIRYNGFSDIHYDNHSVVTSDGMVTLTGQERNTICFGAGSVAPRSFSGAICYTPAGPDILGYQFDEPFGDEVGNTAIGSAAPARGTVSNSGWQGSTGRSLFEWEGCGQLSAAGAPNTNLVNSGYALNAQGDMTIMWWQRMQTRPGGANAYAFGDATSSWRCFTGGRAGNAIAYRGSGAPDLFGTTDIQALVGWTHIAIVVDDTNGEQTLYINGEVDATGTFTPGLHAPSGSELHFGYHQSTADTMVRYADMDDFRMYSAALSMQEVRLAMAAEHATSTTLAQGCPDATGAIPTIQAVGGAPNLTCGNPDFGLGMTGATPGSLWGNTVDFAPKAAGTLPIAPLGPSCALYIGWTDVAFGVVGASGRAVRPFPIPSFPAFKGTHFYSQFLVLNLPLGTGQVSDVLNCNAQ